MENFNAIDEARRIAWNAKMRMCQKEQRKERIRQMVTDAGAWINRNAMTLLTLTPVAIAATRAATGLVVGVGRRMELAEEQKRRSYTVYDRSAGHYWDLKRKLTNTDWANINAHKADGERLGDILREMKVLK